MKQHFVVFYSPGTIVAESDTKKIASWDVAKAQRMAEDIVQRHGATPYGFRFITRARGEEDLDSKEVDHSGMYYLGGKVETYEEVVARNDPKENILRDNMRFNKWNRIVTTTRGYRWTQPLNDDDVVLNPEPANEPGNRRIDLNL